MKIVIIGAGTVGSSIADFLSREQHDITVIDRDREYLKEVGEQLDVQTLRGHAADQKVLEQAGVGSAQLVLAVTDSDEVNLLSAFTAKKLGAEKVVARARNRAYLDSPKLNYRAFLDIDLIISPEILTALEIVKFLDNPDMHLMAYYARGKVLLYRVEVKEDFPHLHKQLADIHLPEGILIVLIDRESEIIIPTGTTQLEKDDRVSILSLQDKKDEVHKLFAPEAAKVFGPEMSKAHNVVIAGGGFTGSFLAQTLEKRNFSVKIIENDKDKCERVSAELSRTTVIRGDVTSLPFLKEERIGQADAFIGVTPSEENNIMSCLLAKELGVQQVVARINRPDYTPVVEHMGIDLALSPRLITANRIMTLIKKEKIESASILEEGEAELIEFKAKENSAVVEKPLIDVDFPKGSLVCAISHRGQVKIPRGNDVIYPGDTVTVIGKTKVVEELEKLFG